MIYGLLRFLSAGSPEFQPRFMPSSCQKSGWERKPEQLALQFLPTTAEFSPYEIQERSQRLALLEATQKKHP